MGVAAMSNSNTMLSRHSDRSLRWAAVWTVCSVLLLHGEERGR